MCNLSRVVAFGSVSPKMEAAHAFVKQMVEQLMSELKRGVRCSDVRLAELKLYEGTGYQPVVPYTGHSVGRVVHEPPYLSSSDQTVLEPGMVVTLEPTVQFTGGRRHLRLPGGSVPHHRGRLRVAERGRATRLVQDLTRVVIIHVGVCDVPCCPWGPARYLPEASRRSTA